VFRPYLITGCVTDDLIETGNRLELVPVEPIHPAVNSEATATPSRCDKCSHFLLRLDGIECPSLQIQQSVPLETLYRMQMVGMPTRMRTEPAICGPGVKPELVPVLLLHIGANCTGREDCVPIWIISRESWPSPE
jgi:hypothetical protein